MATKKEKILESAQRFVLKGQIDKAIKDYQQVVALDPSDVRYRQRLAELLVRDRRKEEAIQEYEFIGKHYAENSYFLKAIAIYKQIQRLSPGNTAVALTVASLNHQQGLIGNALAEYGQVAAQFEKEGALKEALKVVEQMLGVDAEHCATRLKHAELLFATGAKDDSYSAFEQLAASLRARGHSADADVVAFRLQQLFPGKPGESSAAAPLQMDAATPGALEALDCGRDIPGVAADVPAPWESGGEGDAGEELPDPLDPPLPAVAAEPAPPVGSWEPEPAVATAATDEAPALASWEEEIELDLDDDLPLESAPVASSDFQAASHVPHAPVSEAKQPALPPEAQDGIDLQLDFSLELDFDEVVQSLEEEPLDQEAAPVVELDIDAAALELSLPQEPGADLPWEEQPESDELSAAEDLPELEDLPEPEQLAEAEELPQVQAPELMEVQDWEAPTEAPQDEEPARMDAAAPALSQRLRGWEEIYPESGDAPEAELDIEELESHYDLGIGYKEMGMCGGAIKEFDTAARNPHRRLDCLTLQAICYREKGEADRAEDLLRRGLSLEVISQPERVCIAYELAVLLEDSGTPDEAIELYREVVRANPGCHDASRRLSALSGEERLDIIELELEEG
ncbi:TPR domain protein [Citrifermentans bemidjiense Bem]|uniref:TPR domain protein n=1 Tax=Citrifermentans bemidjiense (strain ATCC BAA-1014 / DSM 16622 / JCM 12645 / Bem) TaxID=404380 RepID=B5EI77_CITBB|nr:tetratricopeptide repeat protein [Citrifermentans bemidjiense]ACH38341.1 TPR domain protein [Citrifermentans bemidjiense Bem]